MRKNKQIVLLLSITLILILIPQITFAQETPQLYCVTPDTDETSCVQIAESDREIYDGVCNLFVSAYENNDYSSEDDICELVCCCDVNEINLHRRAFCEIKLGGLPRLPISGETCEDVCAESEGQTTHNLILTLKFENERSVNKGNYYLFRANDKTNHIYEGEFTDGTKTISDIIAREYTVLATTIDMRTDGEYTCQREQQINLDGDKEVTLILNDCELSQPITQPEDDICDPIWVFEYTNDNCGEIVGVVDMNNCEGDHEVPEDMQRIGDVVPCVDIYNPLLCGNDELDEGEECDWIHQTGEYQYTSTCDDEGFDSGKLRCVQCMIQTDFCSNCPTDVSDCDETMCDCETCEYETACNPTTCDSESETLILEIGALYEDEAKLQLTWDASQICLDDGSVQVYRTRCSSDEETCDVDYNNDEITTTSILADQLSYEDNAIDYNRYYCYGIKLKSQSAESELISNEVCAKLPDDACIGRENGESFCEDNKITQCLDGYLQDGEDCVDKKCINPSAQEPRCVSAELCDSCSGPFGLFGFAIYDSNFMHQGEGLSCKEAETENMCFREDYSERLTSAGQFNHCADINSCYDYRTEGSCKRDTCDLVADDNGCEWAPLYNNEIGMGVCMPNNIDDQNCNFCDENPATGGYCSQDLCELYGESCYYNSNPDKTGNGFAVDEYYCNNEDEVGCETYNTQEQCEGNTKLIINLEYEQDEFYGNLIPTSGTNQIIQASDDERDKNICVWIENENKCIRDADYTTSKDDMQSDCDETDKKCLLDFEIPETTILINGDEIVDGETYSTEQLFTQKLIQIMSSETAITKLAINKASSSYPNMTPQDFSYYVLDELHETSQRKEDYVLSYYSKDASNNLEQVKTKNIQLITQLAIDVTHELESYYDATSKTVLSNVTINLNGISQDDFSCTGTLSDVLGTIGNTSLTKKTTNGEIQWPYHPLTDSAYQFEIHCYDEYNQNKHLTYNFEVSEDNILSDPQPKMKTFKDDTVKISINTISSADCQYDYITPQRTSSTFTPNTAGTNHTATINTAKDGVYIIRPTCTFDDEDIGEYTGNNGDLITFGIDKTAPDVIIYDLDKGSADEPQEYNSTLFPVETLKLKFLCDDSSEKLTYNNLFDFSFGCKDIEYELEHQEYIISSAQKAYVLNNNADERISIQESESINSGDTKTFTAPEDYRLITLILKVSDKGDNFKTERIPLRLRNLDHTVPMVEICNPETQICS